MKVAATVIDMQIDAEGSSALEVGRFAENYVGKRFGENVMAITSITQDFDGGWSVRALVRVEGEEVEPRYYSGGEVLD